MYEKALATNQRLKSRLETSKQELAMIQDQLHRAQVIINWRVCWRNSFKQSSHVLMMASGRKVMWKKQDTKERLQKENTVLLLSSVCSDIWEE